MSIKTAVAVVYWSCHLHMHSFFLKFLQLLSILKPQGISKSSLLKTNLMQQKPEMLINEDSLIITFLNKKKHKLQLLQ